MASRLPRTTPSPSAANVRFYVGSFDHNFYAFNAATGAALWTATTGNPIGGSPAVANGVVYIGSVNININAIKTTTRAPLCTANNLNAINATPTTTINLLSLS